MEAALHKPALHSTPWEYKLVSMGNPLEPDTGVRANAVGKLGWELVAIDAGVWVFKRQLLDEPVSALEAIMEETVPMIEPEVVSEAVSTTSTVSYRARHQA